MAVGALIAVSALGGCAGDTVTVTLPDGAQRAACQALGPRWPDAVSGRPPTGMSVDSAAARAYGAPAIIAICGYPAPAPGLLECLDVDGVDWLVQRRSDGVQFTTYGRDPAMDVLVPAAYAPEPLLLPAFSSAARSLPETGQRCR
ncbi:MAG: DUF3515 family protein [Actinomycetales bacterium]|nr:DUF3515 family protein [Actinomycetales bacterium]